jgi:hypothetical protein
MAPFGHVILKAMKARTPQATYRRTRHNLRKQAVQNAAEMNAKAPLQKGDQGGFKDL